MKDLRAVDKLFICNELNNKSTQSAQQVLMIASGVIWHSSIASCNITTKPVPGGLLANQQKLKKLLNHWWMNNSQNVTYENTIELYAPGFEWNIIQLWNHLSLPSARDWSSGCLRLSDCLEKGEVMLQQRGVSVAIIRNDFCCNSRTP